MEIVVLEYFTSDDSVCVWERFGVLSSRCPYGFIKHPMGRLARPLPTKLSFSLMGCRTSKFSYWTCGQDATLVNGSPHFDFLEK